jgi:thioesterase domain-containing protein
VRGHRVEPGEIEAALEAHPAVRRAAVVLRADAPGEPALVAYVEAGPGAEGCDEAALRAFAKGRLPGPMVPSRVVGLERLPLTPNGKLDRAALPPPDLATAGPRRRAQRAPRTPVEARLVALFRRALGRGAFGVDDDFFESGGHSLLALRLRAEIERAFGRQLPLSTLLERPTVARLAEALGPGPGAAAPGRSCLVRFGPASAGPAFFCVHPVGGHVFGYADLARALGPARPLVGVRAFGTEPGERPVVGVEAMAEGYVAALRGARPGGPYSIGGWSFGGVVALEKARQLRAAGCEVGPLVLFDASPRPHEGSPEDAEADDAALRERFVRDLGAAKDAPAPASVPPEALAVYRANLRAHWAYEPRPYDGPALLFRAEGSLGQSGTPDRRWRELLGGLEIVVARGDHFTMLKAPFAGELARALAARLPGRARR